MEKAEWAGAIDNLGGDALTWLTRTMGYGGNIASIGLAESFELLPDKQIFYLRKGIMFTGNENIGMAPRELTAYDVEYSVKRILNHPRSWIHGQPWYDVEGIKAVDKYTVEFPYAQYNSQVLMWHPVFFAVQPEEVINAGANDWRNQTGTGPFILTNCRAWRPNRRA